MNFPASHPAHQGCQWNGGGQSPALAEADVVLVIDSDIPWIPRDNKPAKGAKIFHLDVDPLKAQMPLFYIPAQRRYKVDAETALTQILEGLEGVRVDEKAVKQRLQHLTDRHTKRIQRLDKLEVPADTITTPILMGYFRKLLPAHSTVMIEVHLPSLTESHPIGNYPIRTLL
jgi:acetolactate synthase-1/2/3 large subunit